MSPLKLLRLEWKKFGSNATFWVIMALYAAAFAVVWFLAHAISGSMTMTTNGVTRNPAAEWFIYPQNWKLLAYIGSWANGLLLGFLGVYMVTMEFSNRTLRQGIIFGLARRDVFASKLVAALALALAATVLFLGLGLMDSVAGTRSMGGVRPEGVLPPPVFVLAFFLQAFGYVLLGTLAGFMVRHTALAIVAYLVYVLFLETVARWFLYFTLLKTRALFFLPDHALESLTPFPTPAGVDQLLAQTPALIPLTYTESLVTVAVYLVFFAALLRWRVVKSDL